MAVRLWNARVHRCSPLPPVTHHQVLVGVDAVLDGGVPLRPLDDEPQGLVQADGPLVVREDRELHALQHQPGKR